MTPIRRTHAITSAQTDLESALVSLQIATQALEKSPHPQPWGRERLNYAHAQDLLKLTQRRVHHLHSN